MLIQVFRALRWRVEQLPMACLPLMLVWEVIAVAYMMINVLPFRMGEPVRPLLMSWRSKLPVSAVVGNWVFEKMMDTAAIVVFVHLALLTADLPDWASHASQASLTAFGVMLAVVVVFWLRGERFFDATIGRWLPDPARVKALAILRSARSGLEILPDRRLVAWVFVLTLVLWGLPVLSSYVLIRGFGFGLPFSSALVVLVAISIGRALPAPPGMFGVMQIAFFDKDKIYAYQNLDDNELSIYQRLYDLLSRDLVAPDLVIYLQAPTEVLQRVVSVHGVELRGLDDEQRRRGVMEEEVLVGLVQLPQVIRVRAERRLLRRPLPLTRAAKDNIGGRLEVDDQVRRGHVARKQLYKRW